MSVESQNPTESQIVEESSQEQQPVDNEAKMSAHIEPATSSADESSDSQLSKASPLLVEYLKSLNLHFSALELKKQWRLLPNGFFVDNELFQKLLKTFVQFKASTAGGAERLDDKLITQLFGSSFPDQYYLIEGKLCLLGCFIKFPAVAELKLNLPFFRGSLINAKEQLHPRDPYLSSISHVQANLDRNGFSLKLKIKDRLLTISNTGLTDFHQILSNSPRLRTKYRAATRALRDALLPLKSLLEDAQIVGGRQSILIPGKFRSDRRIVFLRKGGIVFVIKDDTLISVYELRGRNLFRFIDQELAELKSNRTFRIGSIELSRKPGPIIGSVRTPDGEQNLLHVKTLLRMLEFTLRRRKLRRLVKPRFTLFDCLKLLADLFGQTVRIEPKEVPYNVLKAYLALQERQADKASFQNRGRLPKKNDVKQNLTKQQRFNKFNKGTDHSGHNSDAQALRYRSGSGWIFFIHDKRVVKSMFERPIPKAQVVVLQGVEKK